VPLPSIREALLMEEATIDIARPLRVQASHIVRSAPTGRGARRRLMTALNAPSSAQPPKK